MDFPAKIGGAEVLGGNLNLYRTVVRSIRRNASDQAERLSQNRARHRYFSAEREHLWELLQWRMSSRKTVRRAVQELQNMGIHVVMLTGDNERTAQSHRRAGRCGRGDRRRTSGRKGKRDPKS